MDSHLDQIKDSVSIVAEISKITNLQRKGREFTGCCPFHKEKTPSFFVNPIKGFYYCFGCGAKGNIFNLYTDYYRMSFQEAVNHLASQAGIKLPKYSKPNIIDNKKSYYSITGSFANYANQKLHTCLEANNYLQQRSINSETIAKFLLGYVPQQYEDFFNQHQNCNEEILDIGLKAISTKNNSSYTFLRDRIIFPITDVKGNIIAFGGRILKDEKPKYLNTKESKIFSKKNTLYGLYQSLKSLQGNQNLIVVEGYMDVISLHQKGINTAIACLGTSTTKEHISIIKKYDKSPIFCMDGDEAGQKAAYRIIDICLSELEIGFLPRFIFLPKKEDPDSFIQNNSKEAFLDLCEKAKSLSEALFLYETANKNLKLPEVVIACLDSLQQKTMQIKNKDLKNQFMFFFKREIYSLNYQKKFVKKNNNINHIHINHKPDPSYGINVSSCIMLYCVSKFCEICDNLEEDFFTCDYKEEQLERLRVLFIKNYDKIRDGANFEEIAMLNLKDEYQYMLNILKNQPLLKEVIDPKSALLVFKSAYKRQKREQLMQIKDGIGEYLLLALTDKSSNKATIFHEQLKDINMQIRALAKIT